jgi:alpha-galactosidase
LALEDFTNSYNQYKAHFSLWAALKSPLLIGADLRTLSPSALTILNNPAIIAINQDPLGKAVHRTSRNLQVSKDEYGIGETQVWSGPLAGGDQVVLFLNAANEDMEMTASLAEIFVADGPGGSASQIKDTWDVYDLWENRMDEKTAEAIIENGHGKSGSWYNSTELSYKDGQRNGDERLLGKKVSMIKPNGAITVTVPRHGIKVFRLREVSDGEQKWRKSLVKDEL